jgi:hypothetical protein
MNIISESGLYTLIIRSNKPEAKAFRKWVTSEVLPQIRKTGTYGTPELEGRQVPPGSFLMDEIFKIFINEEGFGPQRIIQLLDLATARSALTGEYIGAPAVAALAWMNMKKNKKDDPFDRMVTYVDKIRKIIEESGAELPRLRCIAGQYSDAAPLCERPGFPLALPAKGAV